MENGDMIPPLQQDVLAFSPDQMIWFASKYHKWMLNQKKT